MADAPRTFQSEGASELRFTATVSSPFPLFSIVISILVVSPGLTPYTGCNDDSSNPISWV